MFFYRKRFFKSIIPAMVTTGPDCQRQKKHRRILHDPDNEDSSVRALEPHPNAMDNAPATAEPTTHGGMILSGSDAAKGMAPSVIKDRPMI